MPEERDYGPHSSAPLHDEAVGSRLSLDPLGRKTLLGAGCITRTDKNFHPIEAGGLCSPCNLLCAGESFVPYDTKRLQLHPGTAPGNRLGGHCWPVALLQARKLLERCPSRPQLRPRRVAPLPGPHARPPQQPDGQNGTNEPSNGGIHSREQRWACGLGHHRLRR